MICNVIVTVWEKAEKEYKHRWRNLGELYGGFVGVEKLAPKKPKTFWKSKIKASF